MGGYHGRSTLGLNIVARALLSARQRSALTPPNQQATASVIQSSVLNRNRKGAWGIVVFYRPPGSPGQPGIPIARRRGRAGLALPSPARQASSMFGDLVNTDLTGRWQFSLAMLLRITSLVAMALGWSSLVATARPPFVMIAVIAITASLAAVVGWRRNGTRAQRANAGFLFVAGQYEHP
jgi:hypothetical protein